MQRRLAVARTTGRNADPAVSLDHRRRAVFGRAEEHAVPADLCVVVRVDVDDTGRDDEAARVERALGFADQRADGDDAPVLRRDVSAEGGTARSIHDRPADEGQIVI